MSVATEQVSMTADERRTIARAAAAQGMSVPQFMVQAAVTAAGQPTLGPPAMPDENAGIDRPADIAARGRRTRGRGTDPRGTGAI